MIYGQSWGWIGGMKYEIQEKLGNSWKVWKWMDDTYVPIKGKTKETRLVNFGPNEPNGGYREMCMWMYGDGTKQWGDTLCTYKGNYVCEFPGKSHFDFNVYFTFTFLAALGGKRQLVAIEQPISRDGPPLWFWHQRN